MRSFTQIPVGNNNLADIYGQKYFVRTLGSRQDIVKPGEPKTKEGHFKKAGLCPGG